MTHIRRALLAFVLIHLAASGSMAAVLFNDFGPGNSFNTGVGWAIAGSSTSGGYRAQAQHFTPATSGYLTTIELALGKSQGSGLSNITLVEDSAGLPTGTLLETFSNVATTGTFGGSYPPRVLTSVAQPLLQAGVTYWVRAEPADNTTVAAWNNNNQGVADGFGFAFSPGAWQALGPPAPASGVMRINANPVPEPATGALGLLGLALWTARRRKN